MEPLAPQKQAGHPPTRLSVVMPYFRKLAEFTRVLPLQHAWLARPDLEVIPVSYTHLDVYKRQHDCCARFQIASSY